VADRSTTDDVSDGFIPVFAALSDAVLEIVGYNLASDITCHPFLLRAIIRGIGGYNIRVGKCCEGGIYKQ
jgi:hypothetical protein